MNFWCYKYDDYSLWDQCGEPEREEVELLCSCIRENRNIASFSEIEKRIWDKINGRYAHLSDSGCLIPDVLVIRAENLEKIHSYFRGHRNYAPLLANVAGLYEEVHAIFKKYSHPVLHKSMGYYIRMELCATRMMAVHDLVRIRLLARNGSCLVSAFHHRLPYYRLHPGRIQIWYLQ